MYGLGEGTTESSKIQGYGHSQSVYSYIHTFFCTGSLSPTRVKASFHTSCIDSCTKVYFLKSLSSTPMASIRPVTAQEFEIKYNYLYWGFCRIWWSPTPNLWIAKYSPWCMQSTTVRQLLYIGQKAFGWYSTLASSMSVRTGCRNRRMLLYGIIIGGTMYWEACSRTWCTSILKLTLPNFTVCIHFRELTIFNYGIHKSVQVDFTQWIM